MRTAELKELCSEIVDCPHSTPKWTEQGLLVLRSPNIRGGRLDLTQKSYTDEMHFQERIRRAAPREGDLVITREAPMGEVCLIPNGLKCCLGQRMVLLRPDENKVNGRYLLYAIQSTHVQSQILAHEGTGSTVSNLRIPALEGLKIPYPSLSEQADIARTLGYLDDKIELNRKTNETLEQIARAIYKSWFIDFDPVRAKQQGKKPFGMEDTTAALFPDSFEQSELGEIPKGWKVSTIGESSQVTMGQSPPGESYNENKEGIVFYQGRAEFGERFPKPRLYCTAPTRFAEPGCVLLSVRAPVGDLNIATEKLAIGRGLAAVKHHVGGTSYTYYLLESMAVAFDVYNGEGTVFGSINKDGLANMKYVLPSVEILNAFLALVEPLDKLILSNHQESTTLTATRDLLLPRLLTGELTVKEAAT